MRINVLALALASGIIWGLGIFFLTWWVIAFDGATGEPTLIGKLYRGYTISPGGSVIGMFWGFADFFAGGLVFGWLYNVIAGHLERRSAAL